MLAKRRQSSLNAVKADDEESVADVPTPPGTERRSPSESSHSRPTHRPTNTSSGPALAASRRRVGAERYAGQHYRRRTPTSSPEPDAQSQPAATPAAGGRSGVEATAAVHGKTQFKYKRVKDSLRRPTKRGNLMSTRKSDTRQEGIFD